MTKWCWKIYDDYKNERNVNEYQKTPDRCYWGGIVQQQGKLQDSQSYQV